MTERVRMYSVILSIGHVSPMSLMSIVLRYRVSASPRPQLSTHGSYSEFTGAKGTSSVQCGTSVLRVFLKLIFKFSWFYPDWDNFLFVPLIHAFHLIKQFIFIWCLTNKIFVSAPVKLRRPRSNPDLKIIEDTGFLRMEGGWVSCNYCFKIITTMTVTRDVVGMLIMSLPWQ